jgi:hypothetical protein
MALNPNGNTIINKPLKKTKSEVESNKSKTIQDTADFTKRQSNIDDS